MCSRALESFASSLLHKVNHQADHCNYDKTAANEDPKASATISECFNHIACEYIGLREESSRIAHAEWRLRTMAGIWKFTTQAIAIASLKTERN